MTSASKSTAQAHTPVMKDEVVAALHPRDGGVYVDATFGAGGYTRALLEAADCIVIALDRDPQVLEFAQTMQKQYGTRFIMHTTCFGEMASAVQQNIDGVMLDLGVSSMQLDDAARGFSFMRDGPLDMRMGASGVSAQELINSCEPQLLAKIIAVYGEERRARAIARAIAERRGESEITRTAELRDIICGVLGQPRVGETHPATRTFQAIRIYLNDELGELIRALISAEHLLAAGGTLAVVTFHSLEDRIVKQFLTARSAHAPRPSRHLPPQDAAAPRFTLARRKPTTPQQNEIDENPRARSARLRVALRTQAPATPTDMNEFASLLPRNAPRIDESIDERLVPDFLPSPINEEATS